MSEWMLITHNVNPCQTTYRPQNTLIRISMKKIGEIAKFKTVKNGLTISYTCRIIDIMEFCMGKFLICVIFVHINIYRVVNEKCVDKYFSLNWKSMNQKSSTKWQCEKFRCLSGTTLGISRCSVCRFLLPILSRHFF